MRLAMSWLCVVLPLMILLPAPAQGQQAKPSAPGRYQVVAWGPKLVQGGTVRVTDPLLGQLPDPVQQINGRVALYTSATAPRVLAQINDGRWIGWGRNLEDHGSALIATGRVVDAIAMGENHMCVRVQDQIDCVGTSQTAAELLAVPEGLTGVGAMAAGQDFTCAVAAERLVCWGLRDSAGVRLMALLGGRRVLTVAAGRDSACVLAGRGQPLCALSQRGAQGRRPPPGLAFKSLAMGNHHVCGLHVSGRVICWGAGGDQIAVPRDLSQVIKITAGEFHTCALTLLGDVRCWGRTTDARTEVPRLPAPAVDVVASTRSTFAILAR